MKEWPASQVHKGDYSLGFKAPTPHSIVATVTGRYYYAHRMSILHVRDESLFFYPDSIAKIIFDAVWGGVIIEEFDINDGNASSSNVLIKTLSLVKDVRTKDAYAS